MRFKFKFSSKILMFISLLFCIGFTSVSHAAWNNNAYDYVYNYGEKMTYRDGYFWFAQYGTAGSTSGYRYAIIGFKTSVSVGGSTYSFQSKVGGTFSLVNECTVSGKIYTLWRLEYNKAVSRLKAAYPTVNFDSLSSSTASSTWSFDAIMTYKAPGYTTPSGSIDDYGNQLSAPVYRTAAAIINTGYFYAQAQTEIKALYGISCSVPASSKPTPIKPTLSHFSIRNYNYKDPNSETYWAKPNTEVSIVNESYINKSYGVYPDSLYVRIYKGNYSDDNSHTIYLTRTGTVGSWSNGSGVGTLTKGTMSPNSYASTSCNYISATYRIKFPQDGQTFRFRYTSLYNGQSVAYTETNQVLKIDGTAPSISGATNVGWVNGDRTINITASDSGSGVASIVLYKNDSQVASTSGTSLSYTNTSSGTFKVVATDRVGNSRTATFTHSIDKTKPTASISTTRQSWRNSAISVSISGADTGGSGLNRVEYKLSGAKTQGWTTYSGAFSISTNGKTTITARSVDNAGNYGPETSAEVWFDSAKPSASISTTRQSWRNTAIPVTITASDTGGSGVNRIEYKLSGAVTQGWTTYSGAFNISTNGKTTITARSVDNAGNYSAETSAEVWYDGSKPSTSISTTRQSWRNTAIPVTITASDTGGSGVNRIEYKLSGAKTQDWTTYSGAFNISTNGKTTITARSVDNAGNYSTETSAEVWYDAAKPTVSYSKSTTNWCKTKTITVTVSDGHSGYSKILDVKNNVEYAGNTKTFTITDNGTYNYRGYDVAGNYTDISVSVTKIDKVKPTVAITTTASQWKNVDIPVTLTAGDNETGVARIEYTLSGATSKAWGTYSSVFNISNNGVTTIQARSVDRADNVSSTVSKEVWIDKTKPTGVFTTPTATITRNIVISASSLADTYSGVKEVRISNVSNYSTYTSYSVSGKTSASLNFELDKKSTVAANYTDRIVYIRLIDVAGNYTDYQLKVKVNPAPPAAPTINLPNNSNPLYISGEVVNVNWTHNNGVNDFVLPQTKATLVLVNNDTGYTQTFVVDGNVNQYYLSGLPNGQYTLTINTNNFGPHTSSNTSVRFRYNKFLDDGLVRTIQINPGNEIRRVAVATDAEIPVGCSIEGKIYYKVKADGTMDYTVSMPFKIDSDGLNNVITLPEKATKLQVDLTLRNRTSPKNYYVSPILDRIQVYAR